METLKDKINTLIEDYQRRFKTIKKEIAKGGNDITLTRLGTKASEYQTFVSELSRLKDETSEQSDKLTAEEIIKSYPELESFFNEPEFNSMVEAMEAYHSQFVGEKVTDLRNELEIFTQWLQDVYRSYAVADGSFDADEAFKFFVPNNEDIDEYLKTGKQ